MAPGVDRPRRGVQDEHFRDCRFFCSQAASTRGAAAAARLAQSASRVLAASPRNQGFGLMDMVFLLLQIGSR
jgi:hypothetical protein